MEDHRLSQAFLGMPVGHLEVALGCLPRVHSDREQAAVVACAEWHMTYGLQQDSRGCLVKLLVVAAWVGASVPGVAEYVRIMRLEVGYEELKALGACLKQGASGPMMDLLQVSGRVQGTGEL
jgi:hypothetical protein